MPYAYYMPNPSDPNLFDTLIMFGEKYKYKDYKYVIFSTFPF